MVTGLIADYFSLFVTLCNGLKIGESKAYGHFTLESVIDSWGARIIRIFCVDWIDCRGASPTVLCL